MAMGGPAVVGFVGQLVGQPQALGCQHMHRTRTYPLRTKRGREGGAREGGGGRRGGGRRGARIRVADNGQ